MPSRLPDASMTPTAASNVVVFPLRGSGTGLPRRPSPRALWNLPGGALCPVVGGCLPIEALREALADLIDGVGTLPAFDLHVGVVGMCGERNPVSERLQDTLDGVHLDAVQAVAGLADEEALEAAWSRALAGGDWTGMLWAVLTHGACGDALAERLLRDVHMAQHGAHAELADAHDRARALAAENALLHARLQQLVREAAEPRKRAVSRGVARRWLGAIGLLDAAR